MLIEDEQYEPEPISFLSDSTDESFGLNNQPCDCGESLWGLFFTARVILVVRAHVYLVGYSSRARSPCNIWALGLVRLGIFGYFFYLFCQE